MLSKASDENVSLSQQLTLLLGGPANGALLYVLGDYR